jgi:probable O-glycosylation ligase (exosortase A-associated)
MLLAMAVAAMATTKVRIQAVVWVLVLSLGYLAVKGGGFMLLTGGRHKIFGPADSMIGDNNHLGLALVVLLPLIGYLRMSSQRSWIRWACLGVMTLDVFAVLGTYSRGALLALAAMAATYAVKSRYGLVLIVTAGVLVGVLPSVMPSAWFERMSTIQSAGEDASFEGRVAAWKTSVNIAMARPLVGGGFAAVELDEVARAYQSEGSLSDRARAAHSIFFEVLGDLGFVGLGLYLVVLASSWIHTSLALAATRGRPELAWANGLARMLQASLVGLMVGGSALSMAYYDGFLVIFALAASLLRVVRSPASAGAAAPGWRRVIAHQAAAS